jgi:predicted dehydrogenase
MRFGYPVLSEKPMALKWSDARRMADVSMRTGRALMVAHDHLWHWDFQRLEPSPGATVQWRGPERKDGSCSALLDWGPHAWSMALALGTDRVSTGPGDRRGNQALSRGVRYPGECHYRCRTIREMIDTFVSVINGGQDWRADLDFALAVQAKLTPPP